MMGLWGMGVECGQDYQDQFVQVQGTGTSTQTFWVNTCRTSSV